MTKDVGQAALVKELTHSTEFSPGELMGLFAQGGVAEGVRNEIERGFAAEVLSLDDFLKAEQNLERTPATLDEVDLASILATKFVEDEHDWHTYLYSQKETGREQNNGPGDENTETALGRRKIGIQDPDAFKKEQERKRTTRVAMDIAMEQQIYLERLLAEIEQINKELEQLYAQKDELEDLQDSLSFVNEESERGREARRKWDEYLQRTGRGSLDQHQNPDGSVDTTSLDGYTDTDIRVTETQIRDKEQRRDDLIRESERLTQNQDFSYSGAFSAPSGAAATSEIAGLDSSDSAFGSNNGGFGTTGKTSELASMSESLGGSDGSAFARTASPEQIELASMDSILGGSDDNAFDSGQDVMLASAEDNAFDAPADNAFGSSQDMMLASAEDNAFDAPDELAFDQFGGAEENTAFEQVAQMETFDAGTAYGSFSGSGEASTNVITDHFTAKVAALDESQTTPAPSIDQGLEQDRSQAFTTMRA